MSGLSILGALTLAGCNDSDSSSGKSTATSGSAASAATTSTSAFTKTLDDDSWKYDSANDVYYQLNCSYLTKPQAADYETLSIIVPGKYFHGTKNSAGNYTVTVNNSGTVGGYTAQSAPIVMPVNTPGYAAQKPMTSYSYTDVSDFMKAGLVYVHAGMRGKDSQTSSYTGNAPWGVVDLKSAVRYLRYNSGVVPGNKKAIFVFGHSGGGAQSAIMGASGDSELYTPYLTALGAAMVDARGEKISDAIAGAMCWCPITTLDWANAAYEWNMGQFATTGTRAAGTWTKKYSTDLAEAFAGYQNSLGLKDASGKKLTLAKSVSGTYLAGSYYDYLVTVVENSLNDFLGYTTFPYTPSTTQMAGMGGSGGTSGAAPQGSGSAASLPSGTPPSGSAGSSSSTSSSTTTYKTVAAYIAHLNEDTEWVTYDSSTKKAKVKNLAGFVKSQKNATKNVGAFDGIDRDQTENVVLGLNTKGLHFSRPSADVIKAHESTYSKLTNWNSSEAASQYISDFAKKDSVGKTVLDRVDMYNPMYYLSKTGKGFGKSTVAPHWRIRTGIMQGDTASTTEVNLALALQNMGGRSVDFATVWGLAHTQAETTGSATTNFIAWVKKTQS